MLRKIKKMIRQEEKDFTNIQEVQEYLLTEGIPQFLSFKSERQGNILYLPEIDMSLQPIVNQLNKHSIGIEYSMYSKKLDKYFREVSTGMGQDVKTAIGMSTTSFLFSFMEGLYHVYKKVNPIKMNTNFGGNKHDWNVYLSNITGMGNYENEKTTPTIYWELIKDEIKKRLGNQKMVYVKVYAAKYPGNVIGEVRFDDKAIPELSEMVEKFAEKWKTNEYVTQKQFFFIEQTPETVIPNCYDGGEGLELMRSKVVKYLKIFQSATTQEQYDKLLENAEKQLGDKILASECYSFLPEIVAKRALEERFEFPDHVIIKSANESLETVYISQLSDYEKLEYCLFDIFNEGDLGDEIDNIWNKFINRSATFNLLAKSLKAGENIINMEVVYSMGDGFKLR